MLVEFFILRDEKNELVEALRASEIQRGLSDGSKRLTEQEREELRAALRSTEQECDKLRAILRSTEQKGGNSGRRYKRYAKSGDFVCFGHFPSDKPMPVPAAPRRSATSRHFRRTSSLIRQT